MGDVPSNSGNNMLFLPMQALSSVGTDPSPVFHVVQEG